MSVQNYSVSDFCTSFEMVLSTVQVSKKSRAPVASLEKAKEIRALAYAGWSCRQLAQKYNCNRSTISNIVLGRGVYAPLGQRNPRPQPSAISKQEQYCVEELLARDYSPAQIAIILQRSLGTIHKVISQL